MWDLSSPTLEALSLNHCITGEFPVTSVFPSVKRLAVRIWGGGNEIMCDPLRAHSSQLLTTAASTVSGVWWDSRLPRVLWSH